MKKIFDFEMVSILTIMILAAIVYSVLFYAIENTNSNFMGSNGKEYQITVLNERHKDYINLEEDSIRFDLFNPNFYNAPIKIELTDIQINKQYEIFNGTYIKMIIYISYISLIVVNILAFIIGFIKSIFKLVNDISENKIYETMMKNGENTNININNYEAIVASVLLCKKIVIYRLVFYYKKYFESVKIIDLENDVVNEPENMSNIEKKMLKVCLEQSMYNVNELKNTIEEQMKKDELIKNEPVTRKLEKFVLGKNGENANTELYENLRAIFLFWGTFFLIGLPLCITKNFLLSLIIVILVIILFVRYCTKFSLTEKGKYERVKILRLRKKLEKDKDLTEKEKLFYNIIK